MNTMVDTRARLLGGIALLLLLPLIQQAAVAQQPMIVKTATYGGQFFEQVYDAAPTSDGGAIVVGYTESLGAGESDVYLVKLNSQGDRTTQITIGTPDFEQGTCVTQTSDGGYLIGAAYGIGDSFEGRTIRLGNDNVQRWSLELDWDQHVEVNDIAELSDGSILIAGITTYSEDLTTEGWLSKLDANGSQIWTTTTDDGALSGFTSIDASDEEAIVVGGYTSNSRSEDIEGMLVFVSPNGNVSGRRIYGGPSEYYAVANVFRQPGGGFVALGQTKPTAAGDDAHLWFLRTDEEGHVLTSNTEGGYLFDAIGKAIQTSDGGYAVVGSTFERTGGSPDVWIVRLNEDGVTQWSITEGGPGPDVGVDIVELGNEGYLVVGTTAESDSASTDLFVIALSSDPVTAVRDDAVAGSLVAADAFPNPTRDGTTITWPGKEITARSIVISDVRGRVVKQIEAPPSAAASGSIRWDGTDDAGRRLPGGTYICSIKSDSDAVSTVRVVLQ